MPTAGVRSQEFHPLKERRAMSYLRLVAVFLVGSCVGIAGAQTQDSTEKKQTAAVDEKADAKEAKPVAAEKITVTAERFERPIDLTPQSVSVLDAKEIHARPMSNVQTILDDAPGVSLQRSGALDAQLVIRGLSSNDSRIVLFIDGDRFRGRNFLEYSL